VAGTAAAFKQMIPHGIQGWTPADLRRVHGVRTVVAWGAHDTTDAVSEGRASARALRAPFVLLPNAGHLSMLADPSGVARAIRRASGP
jgi:pimeloyl-ACP methyl ester carboxylesterase